MGEEELGRTLLGMFPLNVHYHIMSRVSFVVTVVVFALGSSGR